MNWLRKNILVLALLFSKLLNHNYMLKDTLKAFDDFKNK